MTKKFVSLSNRFLKREIMSGPDGVRTVCFVNLLTGKKFPVRSEEFVLVLQGGKILTGQNFRCLSLSFSRSSKEQCLRTRLLNEGTGIGVSITYRLGTNDFYTRKQILVEAGDILVRKIEVEHFKTQRRATFCFGGFGQPVFWDDQIFLGLEYPAGYNLAHRDGTVSLVHHPGRKGTIQSKVAVVGVCPDTVNNRIRNWFFRYIDENRARPVRKFHTQYGAPFHKKGIDLSEEGRFFRKYGISVDAIYVLADIGWFEPKGIMLVRPENEQKFSLSQLAKNAKKELGAEMGFHCNTGGGRASGDCEWYRQHFDMITSRYYCLADPRVHEQLKTNLLTLVKRYGSSLFSFDWLWLHTAWDCPHGNHRGHIAGTKFGREAITDSFIEITRALREAQPEIFLEDLEVEHSPWWLFHVDALWSYAGEGSGLRHEFIDGNLIGWWKRGVFPFSSIWYACVPPYSLFGPEEKDGYDLRTFIDAVVMAYLRGGQVEEMWHYIPNLSETYRQLYAKVIQWARKRADIILANTTPVGGDPKSYHVYGYSHFNQDNCGVIGLYNPAYWKDQKIQLRLDEKMHFYRTNRLYSVEITYPYQKRLPGIYGYGDVFSVPLAGGELVVLEVTPSGKRYKSCLLNQEVCSACPFVESLRVQMGNNSEKEKKVQVCFHLTLNDGEIAFVRALVDLHLEEEMITPEDRSKMEEIKNSYWTNAGKRKQVGKREIIPWNAVADGENLAAGTVLQEKTKDVFTFFVACQGKEVYRDETFLKDFGKPQAELLSVGRHPYRRIRPIIRMSGSYLVPSGYVSATLRLRWPGAFVSIWVEKISKKSEKVEKKPACFSLPDFWAGERKTTYTIMDRRYISR